MTKQERTTAPDQQAPTMPQLDVAGDVQAFARDDVLISATSGLWLGKPPTAVAERPQPILLGAGPAVLCRDTLVGSLSRVLLDPDTDAIRALVVSRPTAGTPAEEIVVPAALVASASEDMVVLAAGWAPPAPRDAAGFAAPGLSPSERQPRRPAQDGTLANLARDRVDEASWESFPASDAPGWISEGII